MVAWRFAARSDLGLGSKSRNEDSAYAGPHLLVLCDGMGGHAAGNIASSTVVGEFVPLDGESHGSDDMLDILDSTVRSANSSLRELMDEQTELEGMGTTLIAMLRAGNRLAIANIGDSRAYVMRDGRFAQITKDHSFVQTLLDEGRITEEEALHHPQRSLVTRVMTGRPEDEPELSVRELKVGDRILICSDGLTDYVAVDTVRDIVAQVKDPGECADELVRISLRASVRDNITVIIADVVSADTSPSTTPQVVGAAEEHRKRLAPHAEPAPSTPAEKAAALTRQANPSVPGADEDGSDDEYPELAEEGRSSGPLKWLRSLTLGVIILAVLAGAVWAGYAWSQKQYFVGSDNGKVAIFKGVSQNLGPIKLSSVEKPTDIPVDQLPSYYKDRVDSTLNASSKEDAERMVEDLRALSVQCAIGMPGSDGCRR